MGSGGAAAFLIAAALLAAGVPIGPLVLLSLLGAMASFLLLRRYFATPEPAAGVAVTSGLAGREARARRTSVAAPGGSARPRRDSPKAPTEPRGRPMTEDRFVPPAARSRAGARSNSPTATGRHRLLPRSFDMFNGLIEDLVPAGSASTTPR